MATGYLGISGDFLIVPTLICAVGLVMIAIGTSLIPASITRFIIAIRYSFKGLVNVAIALLIIASDNGGSLFGRKIGSKLEKLH